MTPAPTPQDNELDDLLRALAAAEPGSGFESRLLGSLAMAPAPAPRHRFPALLRRPLALAVLLPLALLLFLPFAWFHRHPAALPSQASTRIPGPPPTTTARLPTDAPPKLARSQRKRHALARAKEGTPRIDAPTPAAIPHAAEAALESQAAADMLAPSVPAPTLPPTAQERAVRLMLRRGERHDLAELDTRQGDFAREHDGASFHDFFDPPFTAYAEPAPPAPVPGRTR